MSIFLTSALLIISIIAMTEGAGDRSASTSTGCTTYFGMLDHADTKENNKRKTFKPNDKTKSNTLQVTGGAMFSNTSVALVVGDKALCMAKTGSSDDCGMRYDALTGTMKFIISDNITVEVGVGLYNWCQTNGKAPVTNIPSGAFMLPRK
uniref:Effector protein n=1 Tax=Meloidogyne incognita TaxID=6306 RepID=A0A914KTH9_MELIC